MEVNRIRFRVCKRCGKEEFLQGTWHKDLCEDCYDLHLTEMRRIKAVNAQKFMDKHKGFLDKIWREEQDATHKYNLMINKIDKKLDAFCKKHGYTKGSYLATLGDGDYFGFNINECRYNDRPNSFLIHFSELERGSVSDDL
jgi:hypothetical protein